MEKTTHVTAQPKRYAAEKAFSVNEAFFMSFLTDACWTDKRQTLDDEQTTTLLSCFKHPLKTEFKTSFWLNHIFSHFYALRYEQRSQKFSDDHVARASFVRDKLKDLLVVYDGVNIANVEEHRGDIQKSVSELPKAPFSFLNFLASQGFPTLFPNPYKIRRGSLSDSDYILFRDVVELGIDVAHANVKRGGNGKPVLEQMCRALGELYLQATGHIPLRQFKDLADEYRDTGPLYVLAQTMAEFINDRLPEQLQTSKKDILSSPCRKIIDELKKEFLEHAP